MARVLIIPLALLGMLLGAIVWSGGGVEKRAMFAFINRGDIYTLDLNQMSYMQDFRLTYAIREGLYSPEAVTLTPIPAGAVGYDLSADKRVWTFHLRKGCVWSNGDAVTARDYVFSWRHMLEEPGEYTYLFYYIKGAKAYSQQLQIYYSFADRIAAYEKDPLKYVKETEEYDTAVAEFEKGDPNPAKADSGWEARRKGVDDAMLARLKPRDEKPEFASVGIEAPDDLTLRVTLSDPVPYLLELVAFPPFYPRNQASMKEFMEPIPGSTKGQVTYRTEYTRPPKVVTNGPFTLRRWDFKRRLILEKSQNYWDKGNVPCDSIEMAVTENPLSQFLMYESGQVDWQSDVDGDLAAELKEKGRKDLRVSPAFGTAFLSFICTPELPKSVADSVGSSKNPLADVRVRQALAMAIDKTYIVENITRMGELPARSYVPPDGTLKGYTWLAGPDDPDRTNRFSDVEMRTRLLEKDGLTGAGPGLRYDPERAKRLLAEAGYPEGRGFPTLPVIYGSNAPARQKISQVLKNQWKATLGINVDLVQVEGKNFRDKVSNKEYAIAPVAWYGDYPDASTFTDKYLSTSKQNDAAWINREYDDLCARASKEGDAEKRLRLLEKATNLLDTEVPIVPMYHYTMVSLSRDNVIGVLPNPRGVTIFKGVKVQR
jgi:oligopeptide transport system substrate-binding protein